MNIDPNKTPDGIDLDYIRQIVQRDSSTTRHHRMTLGGSKVQITALPTVYLSQSFGEDFGDSGYFAQRLPEIVQGRRFLEIGAGTGIVSMAVALNHTTDLPNTATDINQAAVHNIWTNLFANELTDRIDVYLGNVFDPLPERARYDVIFWNHPFHEGMVDESMRHRAAFDPNFNGLEFYVSKGHEFLNPEGRLLLGTGNFADLDRIFNIIEKYGSWELIDYCHKPFDAKGGDLNTFNIYQINKE